jgi:HD-GYP domain-containing protein (c-di-GMP phosphodiesterase class II)
MASLRGELGRAEEAHQDLQSGIQDVMQDVRNGGRLDAAKLATGVDTMIDSITRNPSAMAWVMEMRRKGEYLYQHALACSVWAATFGRHLGLERPELRDLSMAALLCDVGKVRLNQRVLEKPGHLTDDELQHVRSHVAESERIVSSTAGLSDMVRSAVASHHERHDGSGYPRRLVGTAIPMAARIAGIVDSYDAMTSARPYAPARSPHQAVMELYEARDRLFQAELVEQFIRVCGVYPTGSLVELTDGSVGVVTAVNSLRRLRPCVLLLLDVDKQPLAEFRNLDLSATLVDARGEPLGIHGSLPHGAYGIDRSMLFLD